MHHFNKTIKLYRKRRRNDGSCPFCDPATLANSVEDTPLTYIVPNLTMYDLWELRDVTDHLLVVPKRHVVSLGDLTKDERLDIINLLAAYEAKGYHVYARPADSITRSVPHQHTHLIKASNKKAKMTLFLQKPYFLLKF